jgi:hypothetical protein
MNRRDADPELRRQLGAAGADKDVSAVCSLQFDPAQPPGPAETQRQVRALMRRVEEQTGEQPSEYAIFDNLGAFALLAPAGFINQLLVQPEIATATANYHQEDLRIEPVQRHAAGGASRGRRPR